MARRDHAVSHVAAADASDSGRELIYLYCIIEPGSPAHALLSAGELPGLEPAARLFPIEVAGLVAAASRVPAEMFAEEPLNALVRDLPRLTPFVVRHEEAVRQLLMAAPSLVPIAFGAVYRDPSRVADLLRERAAEFRGLLAQLRGRQEWGLKVFRDLARSREAAAVASEELRQLEREVAAASPGRAYLLGKRRERLLAAEADRLADEALSTILRRLADASVALRTEPVSIPERPEGKPLQGFRVSGPDLGLVLKAAFLVEDEAVERFRVVAAELERAHAPQGLRLEVSGPWAAYSFVK